jgi:GTP cyclohydrolase IA
MIEYGINEFYEDVDDLVKQIQNRGYQIIFGVPKGGVLLSALLSEKLKIPISSSEPDELNGKILVVDDLIDSGRTRKKYRTYDFACLHIKTKTPVLSTISDNINFVPEKNSRNIDEWIHYWWEGEEKPAEDAVVRMIQAIGDDPSREGMLDTPKRVIKSWSELYSGYEGNTEERVQEMFTQFSSDGYDELVLLKDIEFFSTCEHHMLPFFGKAHIAYIPTEKVVGISKLARLLDIHSRKFQIQERIGELVTTDIMKHLGATGAACIIEAQHLCMKMRGVGKQHSVMTTSSMKGVFLSKPAARAELMSLIK